MNSRDNQAHLAGEIPEDIFEKSSSAILGFLVVQLRNSG